MKMTLGPSVSPSSKIRRMPPYTPGGTKLSVENILVTVRMRPLSSQEQSSYDLIAWDIIDDNTIVLKNLYHERHAGSYTFDKVFDPSCSTWNVYEEGAKDVALSALSGINATIFAYGQTCSGKTFTMRGVTEHAVKDIYERIKSTPEREFVLKFSGLEIYNETVVDLLNRDSGSLLLLDDPERGTIVDKLIEEVVADAQHLRYLISICEAQRQVGETALNDKSSRSHQIIRLTIESSLREDTGFVKYFSASLNLVDLAGSERAAQTNTDGTRLKEGSHINRSLLTLTTVTRKLSGGKKSNHIPYRDSKLTRILQTSLGGNARTAIICTMSPALRHVEQSRNTLLFATSAKGVRNTARLNMMEREIHEPKRQRDQVQSQLELERHSHKERKASENNSLSSKRNSTAKIRKGRKIPTSTGVLVNEIRNLERERQLDEGVNCAIELLHKEVVSQKLGSQDTAESIAKMLTEKKVMHAASCTSEVEKKDKARLREEISRLNPGESNIAALGERLENVPKLIE